MATGRVGASNLKKARAQDLLEFMRHSRHQDGKPVFEGMYWLRAVPVSRCFDTLDDGLKCIRASVEELVKSKHVSVERPAAARRNVELSRITLL